MQFFPADIFGATGAFPADQLGGKLKTVDAPGAKNGSSFEDVFANVSAYNELNTPGTPLTSRSTRDDNSYFKSDDFKALKDELVELGVAEKVVDEYFAYLAAAKPDPTIGSLKAAVGEMIGARQTADLSKQEFIQLSTMLNKLGFDQSEIAEIENLMHNGEGLQILKKIKNKLGELDKEGKGVEIGEAELELLMKACDLYADQRKTARDTLINAKLLDEGKLLLNRETFGKLFDTTIAGLEQRQAQLAGLAENIDAAVKAMLEYKKTKSDEPVADMRGSALTERSERMARILATLLNEGEDDADQSSTGHLMNDKNADKPLRQGSIQAALADDRMTGKAVKDERAAATRAGMRGEADGREEAGRAATEGSPRESQSHGDKARQDLFGGRQGHNGADMSALGAKVREDAGLVFSAFGQTAENSAAGRNLPTAGTDAYNDRIFEQIERGIIKNATDGSKQLILRLDPPELGKLILSLTVAQGEVKAVIRTESAATTQVVGEQLAQLKQSLEEQGFKVSSLEVETRAQSHAGTDQWSGAERHNQERELLEQSRFLRLTRNRAKEGDALARSVQNVDRPASISATGLHIIA